MRAIDVSAEMLAMTGGGAIVDAPWPADPISFTISFGAGREPASLAFLAAPSPQELNRDKGVRIVLIVARAAAERVFGGELGMADGAVYLLPLELRAIAAAIRDCDLPEAAETPYRLAKSIELLCDLLSAHRQGALLPADGAASLTFADCQRVAAARRLIDESWNERLTLDHIARRCGLNRSKLSRGFRELYQCSVSEALAERRLGEARKALIATDLPVGLIGYRSGYLNNASFTRAFGRRFGVSPSDFRSRAVAA
jgi:AraC family transcriptional activator of pyochelin receptor